MKVNVWIKKEDVLTGKITEYLPYITNLQGGTGNYVQVSITHDEFAQLEDRKLEENDRSSDRWILDQYNRNRLADDQVKSKEDIPYIYERNPDSGDIRKRPAANSKDVNRETAVQKIGERDYSTERGLEQLEKDLKFKNGSEFMGWFHKLTKNEQTKLAAYYNND